MSPAKSANLVAQCKLNYIVRPDLTGRWYIMVEGRDAWKFWYLDELDDCVMRDLGWAVAAVLDAFDGYDGG